MRYFKTIFCIITFLIYFGWSIWGDAMSTKLYQEWVLFLLLLIYWNTETVENHIRKSKD